MKSRALTLALVGIALVAPGSAQQTNTARSSDEPPTETHTLVERMARVGRAFSPTFSPDGRHVAMVSDLNGIPQIWIVPTTGGWPRLVTAVDDPIGGVQWSPTSEWLAFSILPGGGLNSQIYVIRADGTGMRRLTDGGKENNWLGDWTDDGKFLTMASNRREPATMDAYLLDPVSGTMQMVAELNGVGGITSVSRDGRWAVFSRVKSRGDNDLFLLDVVEKRETLLTEHTPPAQFFGEIAPDGRAIYLTSNKDRDLTAFGRIRLSADGKPGSIEILAERAATELDGFELNNGGTEAALVWNVAGKHAMDFIDLRTGKIRPGPALPAELLTEGPYSRDDKQIVFPVSGSTSPLNVWVMEVATGEIRRITDVPHPGVNLTELVKPALVTYRAHDGLELSGWLYRPKGFSRAAPYVLSFHGGPEGQERPAFRSDYQALLVEGIGVFAPNVRGSSGFGKKFVNLDNGELRVDGVKDIKASVDYLVQNDIADPHRVGITGGSYGGYMTMAGLTEFPELFAAGVNLFGIVNFATFFKHSEPWMAAISTVEYGDPATQSDLLARLSPIHKLDRIKASMMVQHGANDTNVPVVEAEQIVETLKRRGVPVEYILFPDEGHGWRKVPNRVRSITEMVAFFRKHLKADRTKPATQ